MDKVKKNIRTAIIVVQAILILMILFECIYPRVANQMKYEQPHHYINTTYNNVNYDYTNEEVRFKLEKIMSVNSYIYKEKDLDAGVYGVTALTFRYIQIDNNLSQNDYIETVCHEFNHLKYNTLNERFITYQTFVTLYNSEFKIVALNMIYGHANGKYSFEYNCYSQIINYIKNGNFT